MQFNANGGEGNMGLQPFFYDQEQPLASNAFTKTGYTFAGWATNATGPAVYLNAAQVSNLTAEAGFAIALFAAWADASAVTATDLESLVLGFDATDPGYSAAFEAMFGDNYAAALSSLTGKIDQNGDPLQVWHDVVAGTDPLDSESRFTASIEMADGLPVVTWNPDLGVDRVYRTYGCSALGGDWFDVTGLSGEQRAPYRFFMVTVEMP